MRALRISLIAILFISLVACAGAPPVVSSYPSGQAHTVVLEETEIHYFDFNPDGSGPVLIWVHGQAGAAMETYYLLDSLPEDYRLIAIDMPGNGLSGKPRRRYTEAYFQDVLRAFLGYIDVDEYVLVAHSLGGVTVVPIAAERPPGLRRVVLVAPYYYPGEGGGFLEFLSNTGPLVNLVMQLHAPWLMRWIVRSNAFFDGDQAPEDLLNYYETAVFHTENGRGALASVTRRIVGRDRDLSLLGQISVPTLIVWGRDDEVLPYRYAERFHADIPGSELVTIDACGHMPHVERPAELAAALTGFLSQLNSSQSAVFD
jgi:pimeloyl-ACP methyl ester carboxylesterase